MDNTERKLTQKRIRSERSREEGGKEKKETVHKVRELITLSSISGYLSLRDKVCPLTKIYRESEYMKKKVRQIAKERER